MRRAWGDMKTWVKLGQSPQPHGLVGVGAFRQPAPGSPGGDVPEEVLGRPGGAVVRDVGQVDALTMRAVVWGQLGHRQGRSWLSRKSVTQIEAGWQQASPMSRGRPAIR